MTDRAPSLQPMDLLSMFAEIAAILDEVRRDASVDPKLSNIAQWFERRLPSEMQARFSHVNITVKSSLVEKKRGLWLQIPWLAFLRSDVTVNVTHGFYVAVLFPRELPGVYLTLMLATGNMNKVAARRALRRKADALSHLVPALPGFSAGPIALSVKSTTLTGFSRAYEDATILNRFYSFADGASFANDLDTVIRFYLGLPNHLLRAVIDPGPAASTPCPPLRDRMRGQRRRDRSAPGPTINLEEALSKLDRRTEAHEQLLDDLQRFLFEPSARESDLCDMVVGHSHLIEAKSLGPADDLAAARLALGQLHLYKYLYRNEFEGDLILVVVFDREPIAGALEFLESVNVHPVWWNGESFSTTTGSVTSICPVLALGGKEPGLDW